MRKVFMFFVFCFIVYSKGFGVVPWTQPVVLVGVSTNNPTYDSKVEHAVEQVEIECASIDSRLLNVISTSTEVLDGNMVRVLASTTVPVAEEYSIDKEYKVYMASFTETSSTHTYKKSGVLATKIKVFTEGANWVSFTGNFIDTIAWIKSGFPLELDCEVKPVTDPVIYLSSSVITGTTIYYQLEGLKKK